MRFVVYILRCADDTYYTGSTNNIDKRLREHNARKSGAKYTKTRRPVVLQYTETYETFSEMRKREVQIKRLPRSRKEKLWEKKGI